MNFRMFFSLFISFILLYGCVATIPSIEKQNSLEKIKEFPELTKSELYRRSLNWVARAYNSANDVIQLKDPEAGQIICKALGSISFDFGVQRYFRYTTIIDLKDSKVRIRYESIISEPVGDVDGPDMNIHWKAIENYFNKNSENLFDSIIKIDNENDW